jgi:hypothetical protein
MNRRGFLPALLFAALVPTMVMAEDSYVVVPVNSPPLRSSAGFPSTT